jgi:hypothetical protein
MKPFEHTEVLRVVSLAWLSWKEAREQSRRNFRQLSRRVALDAV